MTEEINNKSISKKDRERTSAPGLRSFKLICDKFELNEPDRISILGDPARSTYHKWMKSAHENKTVTLQLDTLLRISAVLGIYKALSILFDDEKEARKWLKGNHKGLPFSDSPPLSLMVEGGYAGIISVRRYLDAWIDGELRHEEIDLSIETMTLDDLVFRVPNEKQ